MKDAAETAAHWAAAAADGAKPSDERDLWIALSESAGLVTSEGRIYPLLSRLRQDQLVTTTWRESESGPPRRYYRLTESGHTALATFVKDWARFRDSVDTILNGRKGDGHHGD